VDDNVSGNPEPPAGRASAGSQDLNTVWAMLIEDLPPNQRAWLAASRPVTIHENTAIVAVAAILARRETARRSLQSRITGPSAGCACSHACNRSDPRAAQYAARSAKGVVGSTGTTTPASASPTQAYAAMAQAARRTDRAPPPFSSARDRVTPHRRARSARGAGP